MSKKNTSNKSTSFSEFTQSDEDLMLISNLKDLAMRSGFDLLKLMNKKERVYEGKTYHLQIATSESLTGGLIFSTLTDIPYLGYLKYGGFMVYDTNAKRVFNQVRATDLYTYDCAKEMAIGILKNSNATLGVSVSGNAMAFPLALKQQGEVFIGIAAYNSENSIFCKSYQVKLCDIQDIKDICKEWKNAHELNTVEGKEEVSKFPTRNSTTNISQAIRYLTAYYAYEQCKNFIKNNSNNIKIPKHVIARYKSDVISQPRFDLPYQVDSSKNIEIIELPDNSLIKPKKKSTLTVTPRVINNNKTHRQKIYNTAIAAINKFKNITRKRPIVAKKSIKFN